MVTLTIWALYETPSTTTSAMSFLVDAGIYVLTRSIHIPVGSIIVGEAWTQFAASGQFFYNPL